MEEQILKEILQELKGIRSEQTATRDEVKGLRQGQVETNRQLDLTVQRLESLEQTTNERFESLQRTTTEQFEETNRRLDLTVQRLESLERTTNERFEETNHRLDLTVQGLESLERTTNERFESLQRTTAERFESLERSLIGLRDSVIVLQQGLSETRYEVSAIKEMLATKVIWANDNVSIHVKEGETLYGIIRKESK